MNDAPPHAHRPDPLERSLFTPITATTHVLAAPIAPVAYDCVRLLFLRTGSAILLSEFGEKPARADSIVFLAANTLCGVEPEGSLTITTLHLDHDYVADQVFWQNAATFHDRTQARTWLAEAYIEPAQLLRPDPERGRSLAPALDELVLLSAHDSYADHFHQWQAALLRVLDVVCPLVKTTTGHRPPSRRQTRSPGLPRHRQFSPLRAEARQAAELLQNAPPQQWTLRQIAAAVHLSPSQLGRVFAEAYGKTPMTFLMTLRAERLALLLRETDLPIEQAMHQVGWHSRGHAARMFRQAIGVTPTRYRQLSRESRRAVA